MKMKVGKQYHILQDEEWIYYITLVEKPRYILRLLGWGSDLYIFTNNRVHGRVIWMSERYVEELIGKYELIEA